MFSRLRAFVFCLATISLAAGAAASDEVVEGFAVSSASTSLNGNVYFLNAVIEARLPDYIRSAVDQGFELPMRLEIEFFRERNLWFDDRVVFIKQQYRVRYHTLLDVVSVYDVNSGMGRYFANLDEALHRLLVIINFPVLDKNTLEPGEAYRGRIRFGIDGASLPLPLKSSSLWRNNWDLTSEWFDWELTS